ncbi:MAG TPA: Hpt domain-containing protein, partial [Piscinibacter sp.]|nr:Hpt domain-containing protein [Piscinibacter sp.]
MNQTEQDNSFIAEALPAFISEAQEQIASIEQLLLQLEDAPDDRELLDSLFRCAHTVKGSAGIFGLDAVVAFTHHVETLLDRLREGEIALTPDLSTLLLQSNDQIRLLVAQASGNGSDDAQGEATRAALVARLGAQAPSRPTPATPVAAAPATDGSQCWRISVRFGADTFRNGMDPLAILSYVAQLGSMAAIECDTASVPALDALDPEQCHLGFVFELHTDKPRHAIEDAFSFVRDDATLQIVDAAPQPAADLPQAGDMISQPVEAAPGKPPKSRDAAPAAPDGNRYIRVEADRLDAVINLLGELVIAGAGAALLARQTRNGALMEANSEIGRLIEEIRNGTLQLRMVPIGETFARFRRVVRDTAAELGKDVALEIVGGETELDKAVVERIADPLMHLVRNGLDHGLEPPEQRLAAGKPAQGKLTLSACHESGSVLIRIIDDGRGIQRD